MGKTVTIVTALCCFMRLADAMKSDSVPALIRSHGYTVEVHRIVTEDGYFVELHRIPYGSNDVSSSSGKARTPVLLTHCNMCSSSVFVVLGPNGGLAYMLANNGYDVWLLNSRGNEYSREHVTLSTKDTKFWQFSWHEQGKYDVSASIDYILNKTQNQQLHLIGFSLGATQLFVMLSERPEYNEKVKSLIVLGPAVYMGESSSFLTQISLILEKPAISFGAKTGRLEFGGRDTGLKELFRSVCSPNIFLRMLCAKALLLAGGKINGNVNWNTLPFFFKYFPEPTSLRTNVHLVQLIRSGRFQKYNYGRRKNKEIYGSEIPPQYDLSKVTVPVNVIWSSGDDVIPPKGVKQLIKNLPNVKFTYEVSLKTFSHVDFIWATNAPLLVYKTVLDMLERA